MIKSNISPYTRLCLVIIETIIYLVKECEVFIVNFPLKLGMQYTQNPKP